MFYDGKAGSRIKEYRQKHTPFKQADMAEMLHMTTENYALYERDRSRIDLDMLFRIAEILGMSINSILYPDNCEKEEIMLLNDDEILLIGKYRSYAEEKQKALLCVLT